MLHVFFFLKRVRKLESSRMYLAADSREKPVNYKIVIFLLIKSGGADSTLKPAGAMSSDSFI